MGALGVSGPFGKSRAFPSTILRDFRVVISQSLKFSHASGAFVAARAPWLARVRPWPRESLARVVSNLIFRSFVTPGNLKLHDATASRQKIQQTYRAVAIPLLKQKQHKPQVSTRTNTQLNKHRCAMRRCRPKVTRIVRRGVIHSRSPMSTQTFGKSIRCVPENLVRIRNLCGSSSFMARASSAFAWRKLRNLSGQKNKLVSPCETVHKYWSRTNLVELNFFSTIW